MKEITKNQILCWHGSDHGIDELAEVLADVANGKYEINQLKKDIEDSGC